MATAVRYLCLRGRIGPARTLFNGGLRCSSTGVLAEATKKLTQDGVSSESFAHYLRKAALSTCLGDAQERAKLVDLCLNSAAASSVRLSTRQYNHALLVYLLSNKKFSPADFIERMRQDGCSLDKASHRLFVQAFCQLGQFQEAIALIDQLGRSHAPAHVSALMALVKGLEFSEIGDLRAALEARKNSSAASAEPVVFCRTLLRRYAMAGEKELLKEVVLYMLDINMDLSVEIQGLFEVAGLDGIHGAASLKEILSLVPSVDAKQFSAFAALLDKFVSAGRLELSLSLLSFLLASERQEIDVVSHFLCQLRDRQVDGAERCRWLMAVDSAAPGTAAVRLQLESALKKLRKEREAAHDRDGVEEVETWMRTYIHSPEKGQPSQTGSPAGSGSEEVGKWRDVLDKAGTLFAVDKDAAAKLIRDELPSITYGNINDAHQLLSAVIKQHPGLILAVGGVPIQGVLRALCDADLSAQFFQLAALLQEAGVPPPDEWDWLVLRMHQKSGNVATATKLYRKFLERDGVIPVKYEIHMLRCWTASGSWSDIIEEYERVGRQTNGRINYQILILWQSAVRAYLHHGDEASALSVLNQMTQVGGQLHHQVLCDIFFYYKRQRNATAAWNLYKRLGRQDFFNVPTLAFKNLCAVLAEASDAQALGELLSHQRAAKDQQKVRVVVMALIDVHIATGNLLQLWMLASEYSKLIAADSLAPVCSLVVGLPSQTFRQILDDDLSSSAPVLRNLGAHLRLFLSILYHDHVRIDSHLQPVSVAYFEAFCSAVAGSLSAPIVDRIAEALLALHLRHINLDRVLPVIFEAFRSAGQLDMTRRLAMFIARHGIPSDAVKQTIPAT